MMEEKQKSCPCSGKSRGTSLSLGESREASAPPPPNKQRPKECLGEWRQERGEYSQLKMELVRKLRG